MTLILMTGRSGNFVAMSGDRREVTYNYWRDLKTGEFEKIDDKPRINEAPINNKVVKLSKFAMMGSGGTSDLGIYLKDAMLELVKEDDDLAECAKKFENLINETRNQLHIKKYFQFLNQEDGIQVTISGFYSDYSTGMVSFLSGPDSSIKETKVPLKETHWTLIPPSKKYLEMGGVLNNVNVFDPRLFDSNLQYVPNQNEIWKTIHADQMKWFHSLVAQNQPTEVSKDGFLHSLVLDPDGVIRYSVEEFGL